MLMMGLDENQLKLVKSTFCKNVVTATLLLILFTRKLDFYNKVHGHCFLSIKKKKSFVMEFLIFKKFGIGKRLIHPKPNLLPLLHMHI